MSAIRIVPDVEDADDVHEVDDDAEDAEAAEAAGNAKAEEDAREVVELAEKTDSEEGEAVWDAGEVAAAANGSMLFHEEQSEKKRTKHLPRFPALRPFPRSLTTGNSGKDTMVTSLPLILGGKKKTNFRKSSPPRLEQKFWRKGGKERFSDPRA
ncbi:MAG TPA: hypothetical protein VI958_08595, partial [Acidobacteriota bacterium]